MKLSVRKLLLHDYPASLAWMFILDFWLVGALFPDFRRLLSHEPAVILFGMIWTLLFFVVLLWRLQRASQLFRCGRVAAAHITHVSIPSRGPFAYHFAFDHEGQRVRALMYVVHWRRAHALKRGQGVEALYDPTRPTRAVILQVLQA